MTPIEKEIAALIRALRSHEFHFANEAELQAGIETALRADGVVFEREAVLSARDRVDFLAGHVGVEVKLKTGPNAVIRQAHRYVQHERIGAILIVTSSMKLATAMPREMNGKPVVAHCLAGDAL